MFYMLFPDTCLYHGHFDVLYMLFPDTCLYHGHFDVLYVISRYMFMYVLCSHVKCIDAIHLNVLYSCFQNSSLHVYIHSYLFKCLNLSVNFNYIYLMVHVHKNITYICMYIRTYNLTMIT